MSLSRRKFLTTAATTTLASSQSFAAPYQISVLRDAERTKKITPQSENPSADTSTAITPLTIPTTMPMGSGAPLGEIGTGFVEIRADGCFYEWQIFNSGPWSQDVRSTTATPA